MSRAFKMPRLIIMASQKRSKERQKKEKEKQNEKAEGKIEYPLWKVMKTEPSHNQQFARLSKTQTTQRRGAKLKEEKEENPVTRMKPKKFALLSRMATRGRRYEKEKKGGKL